MMGERILFCPNCDDDRQVKVVERRESYPVRSEEIEILSKVAVCVHCGEGVPDEELDDVTLQLAYETYRRKHDLLGPDEIVGLREKYGLSQRAFARLLGWGEATIARYESGKLPDKAHNVTLKNLRDPMQMERFLETHGDVLTTREREHLEKHLHQLGEKSLAQRVEKAIILSSDRMPSIYNGYRPLALMRLAHMIVFFAERTELWKTTLMKLMFYADYLHFKSYAVSISGASYARLPNGPAIHQYKYVLPALEDDGYFRLRPEERGPYEGEVILPTTGFDPSLFSEIELKTMDAVVSKLGRLSAADLSNLSHQEEAWKEVPTGRLIPYSFADSLSLTV